eukprot:1164-Heterococcus_DN1.PRE.1
MTASLGLCNEIILLFGAGSTINRNCSEVVNWAQHMQYKSEKVISYVSCERYVCSERLCGNVVAAVELAAAYRKLLTISNSSVCIVNNLQASSQAAHTAASMQLISIVFTCMRCYACIISQQSILDTLQAHFDAHPHAQADVNLALIDKSEAALNELKVLAMRHKKSNLLTQFALSRKTQSLLDEASKNFTTAISKLQLGIAVSQMGVNLRIDENSLIFNAAAIAIATADAYCTTTNSALDGIEVKIGKLGSLIHRVEHHLTGTSTTAVTAATSAATTTVASTAGTAMTKPMSKQKLAATVLDSEELAVAATLHNIHTGNTTSSDSHQDTDSITDTTTSSSSSGDSSGVGSSSTTSDHIGTGPQLDMKAYSKFESTLEQLQVHPTDIVRTEDTYIGKGGFAKVYKVQLKGQQHLCAAKVVNIQELSIKQKQRMYLRFAKELFILHHLQHARIVPVYACATTLDELTIVMKYTQKGSLRSILNATEQWQEYTPVARHQILYDIAVGMAYLHEQNVFYRDLKSHNVLIDDDGRALLTDFGLSKTEGTISTSSTTKSLFHGGTLAWTAPELFNAVREQTCTQLFTAKSDVYSYGM